MIRTHYFGHHCIYAEIWKYAKRQKTLNGSQRVCCVCVRVFVCASVCNLHYPCAHTQMHRLGIKWPCFGFGFGMRRTQMHKRTRRAKETDQNVAKVVRVCVLVFFFLLAIVAVIFVPFCFVHCQSEAVADAACCPFYNNNEARRTITGLSKNGKKKE